MLSRRSLLAAFTAFFFGAEEAHAVNISISFPGDGSALKGTVPVTVVVQPLKNLQRVSLLVDQFLLGSDTADPFQFQWDTTQTTDGPHTLKAQAFYKQRVSEASLQVVVANVVSPPPPPPPPSEWPASYTTGPLGTRNPLPPKGHGFLGVWPSMPGGSTTWDQYKQRVAQREADMGRKFDFLLIADYSHQWSEGRLSWMRDRDCIPCVANFTLVGSGSYGTRGYSLAEIANGAADADIDRYADHWKSIGVPVMVRHMHEFDSPYISWGSAVGQEQTWVSVWKHVVDRVKTRGADNVGWWWCPNEGVRRDVIAACYPGDTYVDWVGTDIYNFQLVGGGAYSSPRHPGWAEWWELFNYNAEPGGDNPGLLSQYDHWGARKPFVVGETETVFDPAVPAKKPDWHRNVIAHPHGVKSMPYLTGVAFFDTDASPYEPHPVPRNFNVDYPYNLPAVYQGWKDMVADDYWHCQGQ